MRVDLDNVSDYSHPLPDGVDESALSRPGKRNGVYSNPWDTWRDANLKLLWDWKMGTHDFSVGSPKFPSQEEAQAHHCCQSPRFSTAYDGNNPNNDHKFTVTWLGHATCVVELDGVALITDPVFADHCAPATNWLQRLEKVPLIGSSLVSNVRRFLAPPCNVEDLPHSLRFVLISHNHYDHLDSDTCRKIADKFGDQVMWCVPEGLGDTMRSILPNFSQKTVFEFDWWQGRNFPLVDYYFNGKKREGQSVKVVATPCQHWSFRLPPDRNKSLWCSWCFLSPSNKRFFYAGDTGYCEGFKEIGKVFSSFDLAALPIGAFEPKSIMGPQHVNPEEATWIHRDIGSKLSFGVHWGTFPMADEGYRDAELELAKCVGLNGNGNDDRLVYLMTQLKANVDGQTLTEKVRSLVEAGHLQLSFVTLNCGQTYHL